MSVASWALTNTVPHYPPTRPLAARPTTMPCLDEQTNDPTLLQALQAREMRALELLYDRYNRLAFGLAYRILNDASAAEDVLQEAFLNLWRQAPSYDAGRGTVRSWLLAIVHHRAIDVVRSRTNRRQDVPLEQIDFALPTADAWASVSQSLERDRIRQALIQLPTEQRQTVELAYFAGYSQPEIATAVGVPLSTIKGRMRMAMVKLRQLLAEQPLLVQ